MAVAFTLLDKSTPSASVAVGGLIIILGAVAKCFSEPLFIILVNLPLLEFDAGLAFADAKLLPPEEIVTLSILPSISTLQVNEKTQSLQGLY